MASLSQRGSILRMCGYTLVLIFMGQELLLLWIILIIQLRLHFVNLKHV